MCHHKIRSFRSTRLELAALCAVLAVSSAGSAKADPAANVNAVDELDLNRVIAGEDLRQDLEQFRSVLKNEWILSELNDADFDSAIDQIARDGSAGVTVAELELRLQKVLALGEDGHAEMSHLLRALRSVPGVYPDIIIDVCGEKYVAYQVEDVSEGHVNPRYKYRFRALREGFPYLIAIDGIPIKRWVDAASQYVAKGPELSIRWRAMYLLHYLPVFRRELELPERPQIAVTLGSADGTRQIETEAPLYQYQRTHLRIPKPDWKIINDRFGYIWARNSASGGCEVILEAMPKMRDTQGLVIDLRGGGGGAGLDTLVILTSYLLPPENARIVVGQLVQWQGAKWKTGNVFAIDPDTDGLSQDGRRMLSEFIAKADSLWQRPQHRPTESRPIFLARPEAERDIHPYNLEQFPKDIFYYDKPVVVLFDHRCFSAAEMVLAGLDCLDNVTLVGSRTTAAASGSTERFTLSHSGIRFILSSKVFVCADGRPIDGRGIKPDVCIEPDADYYLGTADKMLDNAIETLSTRQAQE